MTQSKHSLLLFYIRALIWKRYLSIGRKIEILL